MDGLSKAYDEWDSYMELCEEFKIKAFCFCDLKWLEHHKDLISKKNQISEVGNLLDIRK